MKALCIIGFAMLIISALMPFFPNILGWNTDFLDWLQDALLNCGSGIIISLLLIHLYDDKIRQQAEREKIDRANYAKDRLKKELHVLFEFYFILYWVASEKDKNISFPIKINTFLNEEYYNTINYLALDKSPDGSKNRLIDIINSNYEDSRSSLKEVLTFYGRDLDYSIISKVEFLIFLLHPISSNLIISKDVSSVLNLKFLINRSILINTALGEEDIDLFSDTSELYIEYRNATLDYHQKSSCRRDNS